MGYPDVETVNLKNCHFLWISTDNRFRGVLLLFSKGTSKYDAITLRDIFTPPHPSFPTVSSFGVLVGGGNLMKSYLDKHFKPVPVCSGYFKRHTSKHLPNNKQVKWRAVRKEMNKKFEYQ